MTTNERVKALEKLLVPVKIALKPILTDIIKRAFMKYLKAHGCDTNTLETEWQRFNRILQREL